MRNTDNDIRKRSHRLGLLALSLVGVLALAPGAAVAADPVKLYTGAKGGTFFDYGEGLAQFIAANTDIAVTVKTTSGSFENIKGLDAGEADIALVAMGPGFEAWNGSGTWTKGQTMRGMRALFPMYETPFHLGVRSDGPVTSVPQLAGKKFGVGPEGGVNDSIFRALAGDMKLALTIVNAAPSDHAKGVIGGDLDGFFFGAGVPIPAYAEVANAAKLRLLPLDGAAAASLKKLFPYLATGSIPAGSYKGQDQPVTTVSVWNFVMARPDLPEAVAYKLVEAVMRDPAKTKAIQVAATGTVIGNTDKNTFMPFHPGALRYYGAHGASLAVR